MLSNTEVLSVSDDPLGNHAIRLGDGGQHVTSVGEIYVSTRSTYTRLPLQDTRTVYICIAYLTGRGVCVNRPGRFRAGGTRL